MLAQLRGSTRWLGVLPWMRLAIAGVLLFMLGLALVPSLLHSESTIQIRTRQPGSTPPDGFYVYQTLLSQGIPIKSITPDRGGLTINFESQEQSVAAEKVLRKLLPVGFDIARQGKHSAENRGNRLNLRT